MMFRGLTTSIEPSYAHGRSFSVFLKPVNFSTDSKEIQYEKIILVRVSSMISLTPYSYSWQSKDSIDGSEVFLTII